MLEPGEPIRSRILTLAHKRMRECLRKEPCNVAASVTDVKLTDLLRRWCVRRVGGRNRASAGRAPLATGELDEAIVECVQRNPDRGRAGLRMESDARSPIIRIVETGGSSHV